MILDKDEAIQLILDHEKTPGFIEESRKIHKEMKALVNGDNFIEELIDKIENLESDKRKNIRKKYSRSIKDLAKRLLRPLDNIYQATGGNKLYNIQNEEERKRLLRILSDIRDGKSLSKWLQENWISDLYHTDPGGVILLEYIEDQKIYPTYKSINNIRGYHPNGQKLEYLIFEPEKIQTKKGDNVEIWRVVDDKTDWHFIKTGKEIELHEGLTFEHPFGQVPGLINSNITKLIENYKLSPINGIKESMKEYARDQSVLTLYKYTSLFPVFWRYVQICPECEGTGKLKESNCNVCNGEGYLKKRDVTDEVTLPIPEDNEQKIAPDIAGWIQPDLETPKYYREELDNLEVKMYSTLWGSHKTKIEQTTEAKTATEVWLDTQPVVNVLGEISEVAEFMEKQLTEWIANWTIAKEKSEEIANISYGKRFIIESPDVLLNRYNEDREKGTPVMILDRELDEYVTAKYSNNPVAMRSEKLKIKLEPYIHYTAKEINELFGQDEAKKKVYFRDWWKTLTENDIKNKKFKTLEQKRDEYFKQINIDYENNSS